jgi:photosystem II stability/assembly factor-like uncharacterized protein
MGLEEELEIVIDLAIRSTPPALLLAVLVGMPGPAFSATPDSRTGTKAGAPSALAVDASDGSLLKVEGGILRSGDQGRSWQPVALPPAVKATSLRHVATAAAAPSRVYAAGPGAGVIRSDDRGKTWRAVNAGLPTQDVAAFAVHTFRPDTLFVWIQGQGIFRTEDGGAAWQKMDDGPPAPVAGLAHSTLEGSMNTGWLYAATPGGPQISMD